MVDIISKDESYQLIDIIVNFGERSLTYKRVVF